ncbi:hypothetical protein PCURB6_32460 [Paenibacillus curdlanolyticus]|nr:hypothetical protein PCURB6_32460 [Paenibacillus curdlanolyticus]
MNPNLNLFNVSSPYYSPTDNFDIIRLIPSCFDNNYQFIFRQNYTILLLTITLHYLVEAAKEVSKKMGVP